MVGGMVEDQQEDGEGKLNQVGLFFELDLSIFEPDVGIVFKPGRSTFEPGTR
jgi:hypothetical protein